MNAYHIQEGTLRLAYQLPENMESRSTQVYLARGRGGVELTISVGREPLPAGGEPGPELASSLVETHRMRTERSVPKLLLHKQAPLVIGDHHASSIEYFCIWEQTRSHRIFIAVPTALGTIHVTAMAPGEIGPEHRRAFESFLGSIAIST
jgi:hypothetical protein